jgi:hypothetical protein
MSKKKGMTAEEALAEFRKDPEFRKREAKIDEKLRRNRERGKRLSAPLLRKLAEAGFQADSIVEIAKRYAPLPPAIVEILLSFVASFDEDNMKAGVIRQLAAAGHRFDGTLLAESYDKTQYEGLKFAIINTIACSMPYHISDWLRKARRDPWFDQHLRAIGEEVHGKDFARYLEGSEP